MLLEAIVTKYKFAFADTHEWIPSKTNVVPDDLSRDAELSDIPALHGHFHNPLNPAWVSEALSFVNPLSDVDPSHGQVHVWYDRAVSLRDFMWDNPLELFWGSTAFIGEQKEVESRKQVQTFPPAAPWFKEILS
jgi:hypothetical protein